MSDIPSKPKLDEYVKLGLVRSQTHPELPLTIYVYSQFTQLERLWNSVTQGCRGLVVDDSGRCVVRCMPKFFNEDESHAHCDKPAKLEPIVFNKLDGSLIQVAYDDEHGLVVTSKGSFTSKQSNWASEIIHERYPLSCFESGLTYIFELIHPENRIVLDYGSTRELFLLAVKNTDTGTEYDIFTKRFAAFKKAERIENFDKHMSGLVEGVVVKTGEHRYKLKTGEYLRLHRIVTDFTPKRVWEALKNGDSLEFENMPEEFEAWLQSTIGELRAAYDAIFKAATAELERTQDLTPKELGLAEVEHKGLVFMLRNNKDISQAIWKMVKPKNEENTNETMDA